MAGETKYLREKALEVLNEKSKEEEDLSETIIRLGRDAEFPEDRLEDLEDRIDRLEEIVNRHG